MKKVLKGVGIFFAAILAFVLVVALVPTFSQESKQLGSYDHVMKENIHNGNAKVTDIAMLGAHDAFTSGISYSSNSNVNEDGIFNNKIVKTFAKGLVIKMSKAQVASAKEMLYKGVRYFDARITKIDGVYYTTHGILSYKLETYVDEIVEFLSSHRKEFIIFDIQELHTENGNDSDLVNTNDFQDLFDYLDEKGLFNFVKNTDNLSLSSLTYSDMISGNKAGCIILAKTRCNEKVYFRDGNANHEQTSNENIRSYWHNKNSKQEMLDGIIAENQYIEDGNFDNALRVNQGQMTGFIVKPDALVRFIGHWSLLGLANSWNKELVKDKDRFMGWLENMPIVMVDYATTSVGNFNELANQYINEFNSNL